MILDWCLKMAYAVIIRYRYKLHNMCWRDVVCVYIYIMYIQFAAVAKVSSVNNLSRCRRDFFFRDRFVIGRVNRTASGNRKTKNTYNSGRRQILCTKRKTKKISRRSRTISAVHGGPNLAPYAYRYDIRVVVVLALAWVRGEIRLL
jgi:hypothetical protein